MMEPFFSPAQRTLQATRQTTKLADRLLEASVTSSLSDDQVRFVESRPLFFLATVDAFGFPSCSYKGGAPGFVRVLSPTRLTFPHFDGNGMFMSLGNIADRAKIGMLFIDFERPQRLRVRGEAQLIDSGPLVESYPGAQYVVQLEVSNVWVNCPRYVHQMTTVAASPYIPDEVGQSPIALWKRLDVMQDVLTEVDRARALAAGLIPIETYHQMVSEGELL